MSKRRGFTLVEALIAVTLGLIVLSLAFGLLRFVRASTEQTVLPNMGLQMSSRSAMVQLAKELEECIEFLRPIQGSSLTYFIARDKLNLTLTGYAARDDAASQRAGRDLYQLFLHRYDYVPGPSAAKQKKVLDNIESIAFTTLSPGLLQIHLRLFDQGKTYTLLTVVRARNVLSEGEL